MSVHELNAHRFLTPKEVAEIFRRDVKWVYRNAAGEGFLAPAAQKFNEKTLLFYRDRIERLIEAAGP